MPFSASTVRPESSETAGSPVCAAIARALSSALSANVAPVSGTSGASGNSSRPASWPAKPASARMRLSSATLCAFRVARTTRAGLGLGPTQGCRLQAGQLGAMRTTPRSSRLFSRARENGCPSAVPWTSMKSPVPVQTTFMSVSAAESSS